MLHFTQPHSSVAAPEAVPPLGAFFKQGYKSADCWLIIRDLQDYALSSCLLNLVWPSPLLSAEATWHHQDHQGCSCEMYIVHLHVMEDSSKILRYELHCSVPWNYKDEDSDQVCIIFFPLQWWPKAGIPECIEVSSAEPGCANATVSCFNSGVCLCCSSCWIEQGSCVGYKSLPG